jgi:microcompartment protein CcmL/EutN
MIKRSPIALLRCGTVHPGRFLVLVGGSVASTEEAYAAGVQIGDREGALTSRVVLVDVHPSLHDAVLGTRRDVDGDSLAVVETRSSPAMLAAVDAAVKSTPVVLSEVRLGDGLGGRALALLSGDLFDVETASTRTCARSSIRAPVSRPVRHGSLRAPSIRRRLYAPGTRDRYGRSCDARG